jgi:hypothetical protein
MAYPHIQGYVTADGLRYLVWCTRCLKVHVHPRLGGGDSCRVAGCNRKGGFSSYVIVEGRRFKSPEAELKWEAAHKAAVA